MEPIDFFELQAKNLLKDFHTRSQYTDEVDGNAYYKYNPKYFDIDSICCDFDFYEDVYGKIGEQYATLTKTQHLIAVMVGFEKWTDLINASPIALEIAKILFENQNEVSIEEFHCSFIPEVEKQNARLLSEEEKLALLKDVYIIHENYRDTMLGYLIEK